MTSRAMDASTVAVAKVRAPLYQHRHHEHPRLSARRGTLCGNRRQYETRVAVSYQGK